MVEEYMKVVRVEVCRQGIAIDLLSRHKERSTGQNNSIPSHQLKYLESSGRQLRQGSEFWGLSKRDTVHIGSMTSIVLQPKERRKMVTSRKETNKIQPEVKSWN